MKKKRSLGYHRYAHQITHHERLTRVERGYQSNEHRKANGLVILGLRGGERTSYRCVLRRTRKNQIPKEEREKNEKSIFAQKQDPFRWRERGGTKNEVCRIVGLS